MNKMNWSLLFSLLLLGFSCGVNTGNPTSQQIKIGTTGTSLFLAIKKLSTGRLTLQVSRALLIPQGENADSAGTITLTFAANTSFSSGQKISLASQKAIPAGHYDRIALILDPNQPASFISADNVTTAVAVAPFQYYETPALRAANDEVQLLLTLPSGTDITGKASEALDLETDLSTNLQSFDSMEAGAYDYYKNKGDLNYQYSLRPRATTTVAASLPSAGAFLSVIVNQSPLPIQFICIYKKSDVPDPLTYINDQRCTLAHALAEVSLSAPQDLASFALAPDTWLVLGRNPDLALVYQVEAELGAGARKKLDLALGTLTEE